MSTRRDSRSWAATCLAVLILATGIPVARAGGDAVAARTQSFELPQGPLTIEAGDTRVLLRFDAEGGSLVVTGDDPASTAELDAATATLKLAGPAVTVVAPAGRSLRLSGKGAAVSVELAPTRPTAPVEITTVSGPITVHAGATAALDLRLATSGLVTTDFSIDLDYRWGEEPAKHGRISAGAGASPIVLRSLRGDLAVLAGRVPASHIR